MRVLNEFDRSIRGFVERRPWFQKVEKHLIKDWFFQMRRAFQKNQRCALTPRLGLRPGWADAHLLRPFFDAAARAIRSADPTALVLFEPSLTEATLGLPAGFDAPPGGRTECLFTQHTRHVLYSLSTRVIHVSLVLQSRSCISTVVQSHSCISGLTRVEHVFFFFFLLWR